MIFFSRLQCLCINEHMGLAPLCQRLEGLGSSTAATTHSFLVLSQRTWNDYGWATEELLRDILCKELGRNCWVKPFNRHRSGFHRTTKQNSGLRSGWCKYFWMENIFDFFLSLNELKTVNKQEKRHRTWIFLAFLVYRQSVSFLSLWTCFAKYLNLLMRIKFLQVLHCEKGRVSVKLGVNI